MSQLTSTRITVLISGTGTNLQALIDAQATTLSGATIVRVISNRKNVMGLQRAENAGIPTAYHNLVQYKKRHPKEEEQLAREEYDEDLAKLILADEPDLVVCAGFMHILSPRFLDPLAAKNVDVINLHPGE
jgi:phosphoribosylglycinamide formyltransferase